MSTHIRRIAVVVGTALIAAGVVVPALLMAADARADSAADPGHVWSITTLDGQPAATSTILDEALIVPGESLTGAFLVHTNSAIKGPLDVRAETIKPNSVLDSTLHLSVGGESRTVTMQLGDFLDSGASARVVDHLTQGTQRVEVGVSMPFSAQNELQRQRIQFQFVVTVAGEDIVIPPTPDPTPDPGPHSRPPLAETGANLELPFMLAAALIGGGFALLGGLRLRRHTSQSAKLRSTEN